MQILLTLSSDTTPWSEPIEGTTSVAMVRLASNSTRWFRDNQHNRFGEGLGRSLPTLQMDLGTRTLSKFLRGQRLAAPAGGEFQTEWFILDNDPLA